MSRTRTMKGLAAGCLMTLLAVTVYAQDPSDDIFELGEIVVSSPRSISEAVGTVQVVTAEEIQRTNAKSLDEALDLVPGIYVRRGKKGVPRIDMRGMRTRQVELLLNGVPINSSYDNQFDPSFIPVENIARIKVTRGGGSVLYGSGGNAGVINIITKRGAQGVHGSASVQAAEEDTYLGQGTFSMRNEKGNFFVSGSSLDQDGYPLADDADYDSNLEGGDVRENSDRERSSFFASMELTPTQRTQIGLNVDFEKGEYGRPHEVFLDEYTDAKFKKGDFDRLTYERVNDRTGIGGQLVLSHDFDSPLSIRTWGFATKLDETVDRYDDRTYATQKKGKRTDSTTTRFGLAGQLGYDLNDLGVATLAYSAEQGNWDSKEENFKKSQITELDKTNDLWSSSLQYEVNPINRLGLVAGLGWHRQEKHNGESESDYSYQLGTYFDVTDVTRLKLNHARKIRFPSLRRLYEGDKANEDLQAETTYHYEAGVEQDIPGWQTTLGLTVFHVDAEDFIESINDQPFENQDKYRFQGLEAMISSTIVPNLDFEATYTYLESENRSSDRNSSKLQNRPENKVSVMVSYACPFDTRISASYLYVGERYDFSKVDPSKTITLDSYQVVDLKVQKTLFDSGFDVYAGVDNLLDEAYEENYALPRPGRTLYAGVKYAF